MSGSRVNSLGDRPAPAGPGRTWMDRGITWIFPGWGCRRLQAREQIRGMQAAGPGRLGSENSPYTTAVDQETHPDNDVIPDSGKQRRRCTLAFYANDLVHGVVNSQNRQIIGEFSIQSSTGNRAADQAVEDEWKARLDAGLGETLEQLVLHLLIDGGVVPSALGRPSDPVSIEGLPYRRLKTPYKFRSDANLVIRDGFELDAAGAPVAVYVEREESSYDMVYSTGQYDRVPLFSREPHCHAHLPHLIGQTKGLSWYSSAIERLEMVNRWMKALLRTAENQAYIVALYRAASRDAKGAANTFSKTLTPADQAALDADYAESDKKMLKWAEIHRVLFVPQAADYKLMQANAPIIAEFLVWSLRIVARSLGVSFERLTYDLEHTSFSSTKFGDRDDRITVIRQQAAVKRHILLPVHRRIVQSLFLQPQRRMPAAGLFASDPASFDAVRFQLPGRPPVDEMKAESANEKALQNRTASRTRMCAQQGHDAEEIADEIMREDREYVEKREQLYRKVGLPADKALSLAIEDMRATGRGAAKPDPNAPAQDQAQPQRDQNVPPAPGRQVPPDEEDIPLDDEEEAA